MTRRFLGCALRVAGEDEWFPKDERLWRGKEHRVLLKPRQAYALASKVQEPESVRVVWVFATSKPKPKPAPVAPVAPVVPVVPVDGDACHCAFCGRPMPCEPVFCAGVQHGWIAAHESKPAPVVAAEGRYAALGGDEDFLDLTPDDSGYSIFGPRDAALLAAHRHGGRQPATVVRILADGEHEAALAAARREERERVLQAMRVDLSKARSEARRKQDEAMREKREDHERAFANQAHALDEALHIVALVARGGSLYGDEAAKGQAK